MAAHAIESAGHLDEAADWLAEAGRLARGSGNHHEWLHTEGALAQLEQARGDHAAAESRFAALLPEFRRIGDRRCATRCLLGLGRAALHAGDLGAARRTTTEAVRAAAATTESGKLAAGLRLLAEIEHAAGDHLRSATILGAADRLDRTHPAEHLRAALRAELGAGEVTRALADGGRLSLDAVLGS
jgi:hypothetical protein